MNTYMENGRVSVVVPMHNNSKYAKACIDSILKQTYRNIELIVVNDGSVDETEKICKEYEERIIYIYQENAGVSSARNRGIDVASGEYIMFVDGDDSIPQDSIEILLNQQIDTISYDIIMGTCNCFDEEINKKCSFFTEQIIARSNKEKTLFFCQLMNPYLYQKSEIICSAIGVPWAKLYKKQFLNEFNLRFDIRLKRMQDNIFNMYAFYYARNMIYVNDSVYNYRLDHITSYKKPYNYNNLINVSKEREDFFNKYLIDLHDTEISEVYKFERVHLLVSAVKNVILTQNYIDYKKTMIEILDSFKGIFDENKYWKSDKVDCIFYFCLKYKLRLLIYVVYKAYSSQ